MNYKDLFTAEAHEKGAEMQVKGPDGKPLDMYITLVGVDSRAWRAILNESRRETLLGGDPIETEAEGYAKASLGWRGFEDNGKEIPFSFDAVKQLYMNAPYVKDQADAFITSRSNFTQG